MIREEFIRAEGALAIEALNQMIRTASMAREDLVQRLAGEKPDTAPIWSQLIHEKFASFQYHLFRADGVSLMPAQALLTEKKEV